MTHAEQTTHYAGFHAGRFDLPERPDASPVYRAGYVQGQQRLAELSGYGVTFSRRLGA